MSVCLFLDPLLYSIGLHVCFHFSTFLLCFCFILKSYIVISLTLLFFFAEDCSAFGGFLCFHINFSVTFYISLKNDIRILIILN
jgi:hypothetical protein